MPRRIDKLTSYFESFSSPHLLQIIFCIHPIIPRKNLKHMKINVEKESEEILHFKNFKIKIKNKITPPSNSSKKETIHKVESKSYWSIWMEPSKKE